MLEYLKVGNEWQCIRDGIIGYGKTKSLAYKDLLTTEMFIRIANG